MAAAILDALLVMLVEGFEMLAETLVALLVRDWGGVGKLGGVSYIPEGCRRQTYEESEREKAIVKAVRYPKT